MCNLEKIFGDMSLIKNHFLMEQDMYHSEGKDINSSPNGMSNVYVCTESSFTTTFLNSWVVDSDSASHISRDHRGFIGMQTIPRGNRYDYFSTTAKADILGIGNYVFKLPCGGKLMLKDALYSPSMRRNLIFVSQLESIGYDILFGKGRIKIFLNEKLMHCGIPLFS